MKHLIKFNEMKSSDYTIFKIRYYADGINVIKGKFDSDPQQHWDRAQSYNNLFWRMFENVSGITETDWRKDYFLSSKECAVEELYDKYDILIPETEEYYYWFIPNDMIDLIDWVKDNCSLPFQIVRRTPYSSLIGREKTTWRREDAKKIIQSVKK
jgi:hypothetical protein